MAIQLQIVTAYGKPRIHAMLGRDNFNILYTKNNESINQLLASRLQLPAVRSDDPLVAYSIAHSAQKINSPAAQPQPFGIQRMTDGLAVTTRTDMPIVPQKS